MKVLLGFAVFCQLCLFVTGNVDITQAMPTLLNSMSEAGLIFHNQWKIGGSHSISWNKADYTQADTVNIFVDEDRSFSLGHAQALDGKLEFVVPQQLSKFSGKDIHVTAVFRRNFHLFNVETATVRLNG